MQARMSFDRVELTPRTVGEDGLLRMPLTIPDPDPLAPPTPLTYPASLLAEVCLLSVDAGSAPLELEPRIARALHALALGQYNPETAFPSSSQQIDALGHLLFALWQARSLSSGRPKSLSGTESEQPISEDVVNESRPSNSEAQMILEALDRIENRLDGALSSTRPTPTRLPQSPSPSPSPAPLLESRWMWIGLVILAYLLGRSQEVQ